MVCLACEAVSRGATSATAAPARTVLQAAASSAAATALALQTLGVPCAVVAFRSHGRHAVHWHTV